jgi:hypothetical protein
VLGTVLGCLIIGVLNNGLFLLNVSPFWQQVVKGLVILAAVAIDKANSKDRNVSIERKCELCPCRALRPVGHSVIPWEHSAAVRRVLELGSIFADQEPGVVCLR